MEGIGRFCVGGKFVGVAKGESVWKRGRGDGLGCRICDLVVFFSPNF
jgi:hypothetical protein